MMNIYIYWILLTLCVALYSCKVNSELKNNNKVNTYYTEVDSMYVLKKSVILKSEDSIFNDMNGSGLLYLTLDTLSMSTLSFAKFNCPNFSEISANESGSYSINKDLRIRIDLFGETNLPYHMVLIGKLDTSTYSLSLEHYVRTADSPNPHSAPSQKFTNCQNEILKIDTLQSLKPFRSLQHR
jgi:hypothetical protein